MSSATECYRSPASEVRDRLTTRPCMCCGRTFQSEGPHNRLCQKCRTTSVMPTYRSHNNRHA